MTSKQFRLCGLLLMLAPQTAAIGGGVVGEHRVTWMVSWTIAWFCGFILATYDFNKED